MSDVVEKLKSVLAESYVLYVKTQNFHWNVTGPHFPALHALFEQQYTDLAGAVDEIAERIRALGSKAPGSMKEFLKISKLEESAGHNLNAEGMLEALLGDQKKIVKTLQTALAAAQKAGDEATADLMIERLATHDKNAWMLESTLEK